jgi:transcriptional regulator with GAF, ATPase, and Fis domain
VSVLDQFRDAEQRVAKRLKELEPAVDEYRQLEEVAQRLGLDVSARATPPAAKRASTRRKSTRTRAKTAHSKATASSPAKPASRPSRTGARAGQRGEQLIELVRARPGITVREAGKELGVDPTGLYRVVHRLEQGRQLRKRGRGLELVTSPAAE